MVGFHVMTKPIGPICNIDCRYCFYLEKEQLYPQTRQWRMPDDVLERYIARFIQEQDVPEIGFAWQGGEPTLLGVKFFRKVVELQRRYANGRKVTNAFQTNGTLLDDEWGHFLAQQQFLVGLSIDGPRELHDAYRVDKQGQPTHERVLRGLGFLKKHGAEFNTLTVVNRINSQQPLEVYRFLKQIGSNFHQYIPLVERAADPTVPLTVGGKLAEPPNLRAVESSAATEWSVRPDDYGRFLCEIFDEWVRRDVGQVFVQLFDVALGLWLGRGSSLCVFAETCGQALAMEHNGDLYSCDHYVYPAYRLGNVMTQTLGEMVQSPLQRKFGDDKRDALPRFCRQCDVRFACNGECPKHRFLTTPDGEPGLNYLCAGYKRFFHHIDQPMRVMAQLLRSGRPADHIMQTFRTPVSPGGYVGRNDPCPCGSGKKYKKCHGAAAPG